MEALEFAALDWDAPWFAGVRRRWLQVQAEWEQSARDVAGSAPGLHLPLTRLARQYGLQNHGGQDLQFVSQSSLPPELAYESFIAASGQVPTRENLHDFFNALIWFSFPHAKRELNHIQAGQLARDGVQGVRGVVRDAATLFDENAALLLLPQNAAGQELLACLRRHAWPQFFAALQPAQVHLFGHALLEKLVCPFKAITAHSYVLWLPPAQYQFCLHAAMPEVQQVLDQVLAARLADQGLHTADFLPLPVAGIRGWWAQQDQAFYADSRVFRPPRQRMKAA